MKEHELDILNMLEATKHGARLFRNNVGQGWIGEAQRTSMPCTIYLYPGDVLIRSARPLHAGLCVGSSDLIGWTRDGRFLAVEDKIKARVTVAQSAFLEGVQSAGGVAVMAHCPEDVARALRG